MTSRDEIRDVSSRHFARRDQLATTPSWMVGYLVHVKRAKAILDFQLGETHPFGVCVTVKFLFSFSFFLILPDWMANRKLS